MKHDKLCRQNYQGWENDNVCPDCQLISKVRKDEMTKYVQLRESEESDYVRAFLDEDPGRVRMVQKVSQALFASWFPDHPERGPVGEDLEHWKSVAIDDAVVAVKALMEGAWIDDPTMD